MVFGIKRKNWITVLLFVVIMAGLVGLEIFWLFCMGDV